MATFFEIQKLAVERMDQAIALAEEFGYETVVETIREKREEMLRRELTVVVAGEVKRGKSSLLNALLNETQSICPVDMDVCTNAATILRYGETEKILVYIANQTGEAGECFVKEESIPRSRLQEYVSEQHNPGNFKNVIRIEAQIPNALLKEGVVFVDTPGVGSLNAEHAETTFSFLPNADMLLFVTDAVTPMTDTELKFLKRGYAYCSSVVFPLTKKDLSTDPDVILAGNRKKISNALDIPEDQVLIVPVSSAAKLKYLEAPQKRLLYKNSNYALLEETIWTAIAKRQAEILIQPYLMVAESELRKMIDNMVAQHHVIGESSAAKKLSEKLAQYQDELRTLLDEGADWRDELSLFFTSKQIEVGDKLTNIKTEAQAKLAQQRSELKVDICEPENYNSVVGALNDIFIQGRMAIQYNLESELNSKILDLRDAMKLNMAINQSILDGMNYKPADTVSVTFPTKSKWDIVKKQGRDINSTKFGIVGVCSTLGTAVGGIGGGVLGAAGGGVGGAISGALGGAVVGEKAGQMLGTGIAFVGNLFSAAKKIIKGKIAYDESDAALVHSELQSHINITHSGISSMFNIALKTLQQDTVAGFKKLLRNRELEIKQNITSVNQSLTLEKNEIPRRKKELQDKIDRLKTLLAQLIELQNQIESIGSPAGKARAEAACTEEKPPKSAPEKSASEPAKKKKVVDYGFL